MWGRQKGVRQAIILETSSDHSFITLRQTCTLFLLLSNFQGLPGLHRPGAIQLRNFIATSKPRKHAWERENTQDSKNPFQTKFLKCSTIDTWRGWCGRRKRTKNALGPQARILLYPPTQRLNFCSIQLIIYWRGSQSKHIHTFLSSTGGCTIRQEILSEWVNKGPSCKASKKRFAWCSPLD